MIYRVERNGAAESETRSEATSGWIRRSRYQLPVRA